MTDLEFHLNRRMFATMGGALLVAAPQDGRTHFEWFRSMFSSELAREWMSKSTRGYYLDGRVAAYRGDDFSHRGLDHPGLIQVIDFFSSIYPPVIEIGFGAIAGQYQPWQTKKALSVEDYRRHVKLGESQTHEEDQGDPR